jgi:hypothetical protein
MRYGLTMRPRLLALTLLALPACGGCEGDDPSVECLTALPPPAGGAETVRVGVLEAGALVPLDEAGPQPLHRGAQGGQHFYVTLERYALTDPLWQHELTVTDDAGAVVGSGAAFEEGCAPGWVRDEGVSVPVRTPTVAGGRVRVVSSALDADYTPLRSITVDSRVELLPP